MYRRAYKALVYIGKLLEVILCIKKILNVFIHKNIIRQSSVHRKPSEGPLCLQQLLNHYKASDGLLSKDRLLVIFNA